MPLDIFGLFATAVVKELRGGGWVVLVVFDEEGTRARRFRNRVLLFVAGSSMGRDIFGDWRWKRVTRNEGEGETHCSWLLLFAYV